VLATHHDGAHGLAKRRAMRFGNRVDLDMGD